MQGDKVARCQDLPSKHFIRKGATYHLLGGNGELKHHDQDEWVTKNSDFVQLELEPTSPLYSMLCGADANGDCTLPSKVVLEENLVYDEAAKNGVEYAVDTIRSLRFKVGSTWIYYEYLRPPCVEHSYYRNGKRVTKGQIKKSAGSVEEENMCADPLLEAATPMCSSAGWETSPHDGSVFCHYQHERMTYDSAIAICEANGLEQGWPGDNRQYKAGPCQYGIANRHYRSWANSVCSLKTKVHFESGQIAIIHAPGPDRSGAVNVEGHVDTETLNFFGVPWEGGTHPTMSDCLSTSSCSVHGTEYCICDTDPTESQVYTSSVDVASIDQLISELHIGAPDIDMFDANTYTNLGSCNIPNVMVYSKTGDCSSLSIDTIFNFERNSKQYFLMNSKSVVSIPGSSFAYRNPVQFISLSDPEKRDAYYETDEVLDSLFYDSSHPPFMALRVIQRFGISNPSPGFIHRVATAYKQGWYGQFGSGGYGDLGAMVAAILLDDESRSVVLDTDQSHGALREPLIKVISFFKSMGLQYESPLHIPTLMDMEEKIGQGSFE